jgi:hypothetical protein
LHTATKIAIFTTMTTAKHLNSIYKNHPAVQN